ncbi:MAG: Na/Pi symporter [Alphaproteobacteria bacterium]
MDLIIIGGALGGIGLFLLGMRLMTEGLKLAAGALLRDILSEWTRTRLRGLLSGIVITGLVQSSSAVTVASIGFVNAGILTLGQAIWVVFGSNVGTTMTGWIVAIVGFNIKIEAFALPLLGVGMLLSLTGSSTRRGAFGDAIAGFGILFLGIATLKTTFAGLGNSFDVSEFAGGGVLNDALFALIGFILTSLIQSSSAVIVIAITAVVGDLLPIESGAALVIGANVGTTTTALIAVLGATSNAKRVALSHMTFNGLTGLIALLILPLMLLVLSGLETAFSIFPDPAVTLALFHTLFNVLGVLLVWPIADRLEKWLSTRFMTEEEDLARPRHLDPTSIEVPSIAVRAILLELGRTAEICLGAARKALTDNSASVVTLSRRRQAAERLSNAIIKYVQQIGAAKHSLDVAKGLSHPIRALMHFLDILDHAIEFLRAKESLRALPDHLNGQFMQYLTLVEQQMDTVMEVFENPNATPLKEETLEPVYQNTKSLLLEAASTGELSPDAAETALDALGDIRAIVRLLNRAEKRVAALAAVSNPEAVAS